MEPSKKKSRPKKPPPQNPIEAAIRAWFHTVHTQAQHLDELVSQAPKRWTVYEPMILLPTSSFETPAWKQIFSDLSSDQTDELWIQVLSEISKRTGGTKLTHLAVNEGIPAALHHQSTAKENSRDENQVSNDEDDRAPENILRSPTGLRILHGDFGPASVPPSGGAASTPEPDDFDKAFWVSTRQNGVFQTWAPRWTMFSRGNIKEKARLLDFYSNSDRMGLSEDAWAIDLYAGIGYFTFSYAKLGMRVVCWELNGWSVEGLRRGARGNGWSVKVVKDVDELKLPMREILKDGEQIVVFLEDNREAAKRMEELMDVKVAHVNCGLLPTSDASWEDAWDMAMKSESDEVWLHLHENVGVADIDERAREIERFFLNLAEKDNQRTAHVEHTELVKTFAPGVWHCVFDLRVTRSSSIT